MEEKHLREVSGVEHKLVSRCKQTVVVVAGRMATDEASGRQATGNRLLDSTT